MTHEELNKSLKPCPFCGGEGGISMSARDKTAFCSCWDCGARGSFVRYEGEVVLEEEIIKAIELWNTRAGE